MDDRTLLLDPSSSWMRSKTLDEVNPWRVSSESHVSWVSPLSFSTVEFNSQKGLLCGERRWTKTLDYEMAMA